MTLSKVFIAVFVALIWVCTTVGQEPQQVKISYQDLLAKVKSGDRSVNFKDLRMTYTETKDYSPYGGNRESRKAMFAALNAEKY